MSPDGSARPKVDPATAWVSIDSEIVALHPSTGEVHLISPSGALLFPLLDGYATVNELAHDVADVMNVSVAAARHDILEFVACLSDAGLLLDEAAEDA